MKKAFFVSIVCLCVLSCKGGISDTLNPLAPRTVEVENTTSLPINIKVYTVHNSGLSFSGIINPGDKKVFSGISECNIEPATAYNWKLERSYDKSGYQRFKFRDLTAAEKEKEMLDVTVWNTNIDDDDVNSKYVKLKYRVKASGTAFETTSAIKKGKGVLITLYNTDYEFELDNPPALPTPPPPPAPKQIYDISYNKAEKKITITQVPTKQE